MCKSVSAMTLLTAPLILISACSTRPALKANPRPETTYEVRIPQSASRYALKSGETAVKPILDKQIAPVYPSSLVLPGAEPVTVVAHLVMDEDGHVKNVYPVSAPNEGPHRTLFEAAVRQAALQWRFTPFWVQQPRPDGTYLVTQKPFSLWYVFHFNVVGGKPVVESTKR
jgi:hypothetical protein